MADFRNDKSEVLHYDNPDFQVFFRRNNIPGCCTFDEMKIHWHDEVEFIYVVRGQIGYQLNGSYVSMKEGEGIFVNSRQLHVIKSENVDCELYCLIFHPVVLSASKHIVEKHVNPIIENDSIPYVVLSENEARQRRMLHDIKEIEGFEGPGNDFDREYDRKPGHELGTMRLIYDIWSELYHYLDIEHKTDIQKNHGLAIVERMMNYVYENYQEKLSLEKLCEVGNIGKTKCESLFDKYLNMSPMEYVRNYRLEKSFGLLENTDMTVTQIALETGFADGSYFSKVFRANVGLSPQEYRRNKKEEAIKYERMCEESKK